MCGWRSGPIPRAAGYGYVWGDLLAEDAYRRCDLRIINLETAITAAAKSEASETVVSRTFPLAAPRNPICFINRSTVHPATSKPSRFS